MNTIFRLCLLLLMPHLAVHAQTFRAYVSAGDEAAAQKDEQAAMLYYAEALKLKPDAPEVLLKYADRALAFYAFEAAKTAYQKILGRRDAAAFPSAILGMGLCLQQTGKYADAISYFEAYLQQQGASAEGAAEALHRLEQARWASARRSGSREEWKVEHLGRSVNTPYSEFAPVVRGDTLYYSSMRYELEGDKHRPPRKVAKVLYQSGKSRGRPLRHGFNADTAHTANFALSPDGQRAYFTVCRYTAGAQVECRLYMARRGAAKRWPRKSKLLPGLVNQPGFSNTQPAVGYDSLKQQELLFFVRQPQEGGADIFVSDLDSLGMPGEPRAVSGINTAFREMTPWFSDKEQALYFSSDGWPGLGGLDVYRLQWPDGAEPEHLGQPLNTSYNDFYFTKTADGLRAYFASNRPGSYHLDRAHDACCNDIYLAAELQDTLQLPPVPDTLLAPPPVAEAPPEPTRLSDFLPLRLYFDNDEPEPRTRRTATRLTYGRTVADYLEQEWAYAEAFAEGLSDTLALQAEDAVARFFSGQVAKGQERLELFCGILLSRLETGDTLEIFMKGYTSPRAQNDYNLALSQRRISSVRNHFEAYGQGALLPFLKNGQLKLTELPYGESEASNEVSDALDDRRNSIYHPDAARERRVEILEVRG